MNTPIKARAVFFIQALLLAWSCQGFPIEPVTLRELVAKSDLIIYAKVEPSAKKPSKRFIQLDFPGGESPARLSTTSVLKGVPPKGIVEVHFNPNLICPSPPRFPVGSNVLAFLQHNAGSNGFHTVALSYGANVVSQDEAHEFSTRITELVQITTEHDPGLRARETTEWLVKCVEGRVARWDGASDLSDRTGLLGQRKTSDFAKYLTEQQITRMSNSLFQAEYVTSGELALTDLFKDRAKHEVVDFLISYLRKASNVVQPMQNHDYDSLPEPWNVYDVMLALVKLIDSPTAKAIVKESQRTSFFHAEERISRIKKFLPVIEAAAVDQGYLKGSLLERR